MRCDEFKAGDPCRIARLASLLIAYSFTISLPDVK